MCRGRGLVGRDNFDVDDFGVERIAGNRVFQSLLVCELNGLCDDEVLLVSRKFRLRARDIQRSHRTDFELLSVVAIQLFRNSHGLLLDSDILPGVGEFPIGGDGIRDGGDSLLRKSQVGDFAVVVSDDNIPAVHGQTKAAQQILTEANEDGRLHVGVKEVGRGGARGASVVVGNGHACSGREILGILRIVRVGVNDDGGGRERA